MNGKDSVFLQATALEMPKMKAYHTWTKPTKPLEYTPITIGVLRLVYTFERVWKQSMAAEGPNGLMH